MIGIVLANTGLVLASLACQAVIGEGTNENTGPSSNQDSIATGATSNNGGSETSTKNDFPMIDDAFDVVEVGDGSRAKAIRLENI